MDKKKSFSLNKILIISVIFTFVFLKNFSLSPEKKISEYTHDTWTTETSLPQASVQAIYQSKDGYLWLGTQEGLVRFDGVRFVQFGSEDISSFFEDSNGVLWMSTYNGIQKFKDGKFEIIGKNEGLSSQNCNNILIDSKGQIWAATNYGLNCFKDGKWKSFTKKEGMPGDRITSIVETHGGAIWAGTQNGLVKFEDEKIETFSIKEGLPHNHISSLFESREGILYVGTMGGGICSIKKGKILPCQFSKKLPGLNVTAIYEDKDGNLWVGFQPGGLARIRDGIIDSYGIKDGLSDNTVWSIYEDREGSLWVGTFGGGLNRFRDTKFSSYDSSYGLASDSAWVVYEDSQKNLWIGTDQGLNCLKNGKLTLFTTKEGLSDNNINALVEDKEGALWVGTDKGISKLKNGKIEKYGAKDGLTNEAVFSLFEDRKGRIWIGTNGGGVNIYENGKFTSLNKDKGLSENFIRTILEDKKGNIWIGTNGGGLIVLWEDKLTIYSLKDGLSSSIIRALYEDREGTIWVGTRGGGLCRFKNGKFESFRMENGLLSDIIFQILEDSNENLWLSCNKGIFKVSKKSIEDFSEQKTNKILCTTFGKSDGMKSSECTGGTQPAGWKTYDGKLWFPTIKGIVSIDPENIKFNEVVPPVVLEEILIDGKSTLPLGRVVAPPGSDRIEFKFTALSFLAPEKVSFKYKLEGHDKDFIELAPGRERIAVYTNIPPGDYIFKVKASNNDGIWNETGVSLSFHLKPQFHQTYYFYFLLLLLTLVFGALIYHFSSIILENFRIGKTLSRYHSKHLIENLRASKYASEQSLSTERKKLTIMFGDLLGFSDFSDRCEPETVDRVINEYLTEMALIIEKQEGTIARFMGDGIMAFWGAPKNMEPTEQSKKSVKAAVLMQEKMAELEKKWLLSGIDHTLKLRIGISQDYATVGNMGSKDLMEYTALGSAVNLAARLENGCVPGKILVSYPIYVATKNLYNYEEPVMREFKGFARAINVAELDPLKKV
ncbi:MAG: two-component regulator propeller domain-containing protein [Acidobacteriota bacterium]